jgi:uncharacterized protein YqeY
MGSGQLESSCLRVIGGLDSDGNAARQRRRFGLKTREKTVLREKISDGTKAAMKSGDKLRLSTLRLVSAAIKNAEIEARTSGKALTDDDLLGLLQKMIKQRQESVELYDKGGRKELADQERGEIAIIQEFLPQQMGDAEAKAAIAEVIKKEGATGVKDMGKVMAALKAAYAGKMDFGKASALVKQLLAN